MKKSNRRQFLKSAANSAGVVAARIGASRFMRTLMFAFVLSVIIVQNAVANDVIVSENNKVVSLQNEYVKVNFDLRGGYYQVVNVKENLICIDKAYAEVNGWKTTDTGILTWKSAQDHTGQFLLIEHKNPQNNNLLLLKFSLSKGTPYLILYTGIKNVSENPLFVKRFSPLAGGKIFNDKNTTENLRILDGNGGGEKTMLRNKPPVWCRNNMLITFGNKSQRYSVVMGGITYNEFNKSVRFEDSICLYAEDFVGKRVDSGTTYLPKNDCFYLDCVTNDPFASLETYGKTLAKMQNVHLTYYYFPTICMWYAMHYGRAAGATNDSPGAVAEMQHVKDGGWLKYTKMAIRLVPDCYASNNENGWWDDEHWQMHGQGDHGAIRKGVWFENEEWRKRDDVKIKHHYREPYETTAKWAGAVTALGGIPLTYFQTATRSIDYVEKFPEQMLFNEPYHKIDMKQVHNFIPNKDHPADLDNSWDWQNKSYATYDFTDKDFRAHLQNVYKNLNDGGVRGLMYDYAANGWAMFGGMDDKYATAGSAYRAIFQLARDGLGKDAYLHERNLQIGSDITLGIVSSQRIWGDTDIATPEIISRGGLRWYKNRVVVGYDMDAKNLLKASPNNDDGLHKLLTMSYTAGSRLLLANSFSTLGQKHIFALSRIFPYHSSPLTARPVDMLTNNYPQIYSFRISDDWQQVVFYNQNDAKKTNISVGLSDKAIAGGLELRPDKFYYVYDFWNRQFVGKISGTDKLTQELRAGETRMMSIHAVEEHPQIISTDRHLLQGYVELSEIKWDAVLKTLTGKAKLVENEPMTITIALNGFELAKTEAENASITTAAAKDGLLELILKNKEGGETTWKISLKK
jgi:hypothetical protein